MDKRLLQKLLFNAQKSKKELDKKVEEIRNKSFLVEIGNGMLSMTFNGNYELLNCNLSDTAMTDKETLQDLVIAGVNEGISKIHKELKEVESQIMSLKDNFL